MIFKRFALTIPALLVAFNLAAAQAPAGGGPPGPSAGGGGLAPPRDQRPADQWQMYEDIEIMRRLILTRLGSRPPSPRYLSMGTAASPMGTLSTTNIPKSDYDNYYVPSGGNYTTGQLHSYGPYLVTAYDLAPASLKGEGVYLKGQGVIYTFTMPPSAQDPRPETSKPASKPASDWERTRQQIRGEKADQGDNVKEPKEPKLADIVLKVLADNGHNFKQVGDQENITVVITFRAEAAHRYPTGMPAPNQQFMGTPGGSGAGMAGGGAMAPIVVPPPSNTPLFGIDPAKPVSTGRDHELLGDLHYRQNRVQEAITEYARAIEMASDQKTTAGLYQKMAQAFFARGDTSKAEDAMKHALALIADQAKTVEAGSKAAAPSSLPAKLIISAPKKLLDQAGAGKLSLEEFKKAASVEYLTFPSADKKPEEKPAK